MDKYSIILERYWMISIFLFYLIFLFIIFFKKNLCTIKKIQMTNERCQRKKKNLICAPFHYSIQSISLVVLELVAGAAAWAHSHLLQLFWQDLLAFPGQPRDILDALEWGETSIVGPSHAVQTVQTLENLVFGFVVKNKWKKDPKSHKIPLKNNDTVLKIMNKHIYQV